MFSDACKKSIENQIADAISEISVDMQTHLDVDANKVRAEIIRTLAEAYSIIKRGRKQNDL